ncbi:fatty acid desaturase family protein [Streptomyces filamentosus]|uniref:fatty acid desaturase family protein n=1 Tax=Streptomyces filamentosus TaxID=67294 RepID=UPI00123A2035|nr:acyl-CoA desaturase [Streptomyces filamentosus]KAA6211314.1 acyl-CoA desaturase [Streptomyces filamentosus]
MSTEFATTTDVPTTSGAPTRRPAPGASDFARLSRRMAAEGLLDRRPLYYTVRFGLVLLAFAGGWYALFALGDTWLQLGLAAAMAVVFAQVALISHDLAHRQVFSRRLPSEIAGRVAANLLMGMSYGWWMNKHTRHHANPNHEERDPDVAPDILVWSKRQAREASGLARFIGRRQAYLFFPLLLLEGLNLSFNSFRALRSPTMKRPVLEGALLVAHFAAYFGAVFAALPAGKAVAFLAVHQALIGVYMGCVFAPNHKGMLMVTPGMKLDFLRRQVLTSRNVRGGPFVDTLMGGLNHQVEHHLFPSMPTPALGRAAEITRAFCEEEDIPYYEVGLLRSYREILGHLHRTGEPIREAR